MKLTFQNKNNSNLAQFPLNNSGHNSNNNTQKDKASFRSINLNRGTNNTSNFNSNNKNSYVPKKEKYSYNPLDFKLNRNKKPMHSFEYQKSRTFNDFSVNMNSFSKIDDNASVYSKYSRYSKYSNTSKRHKILRAVSINNQDHLQNLYEKETNLR